MPKIKYVDRDFKPDSMAMIKIANAIISDYAAQGYDLTVRQLYYQFVSKDLIKNSDKSYKRLSSIINDARLAGLIDWKAIVDRTRNLESNPHWEDPKQFMEVVTPQFQMDKWVGQDHRVEVWVEKDALSGVIERPCRDLDVAYFSCRGYTSQSEMWAAAMRLKRYSENGQTPVIIHLGDHDPSGIDMSRDIFDRIELFMGGCEINRIALNMNQVEKYNPPPNPAKITDSRAADYIKIYGDESWELDALDPKVMDKLIRATVKKYRDEKLWTEAVEQEAEHRAKLEQMAEDLD